MELSSLNGEGVNTGLHYMEIFDNGITFQYDLTLKTTVLRLLKLQLIFIMILVEV